MKPEGIGTHLHKSIWVSHNLHTNSILAALQSVCVCVYVCVCSVSGLPLPTPEDLPDLGLKSLTLTGGFFTTAPSGKPYSKVWLCDISLFSSKYFVCLITTCLTQGLFKSEFLYFQICNFMTIFHN